MRFTLTSRRVYYLAAGLMVVIVAWAVGLVVSSAGDDRRSVRESTAPAAAEIESTIKRAESGDPAAEHQLARTYAVGDGLEKNEKAAVVWLERAAQHGDVEAQYELGMALLEGRGTVQDYERALKVLRRAADAGNGSAQVELGRMYFTGAGTPVDNVQAYTWLNIAAAQGATGAASLRDVVRARLSADQIVKAQAYARLLSEMQPKQPAKGP